MENAYINDFTNTVQIYYNDLSSYNPLEKEEEAELFAQIREGDIEARNRLIEANLKFVFNIAKKFKGQGVEMPELIAEGNIGLLKALDKFDDTRGVKFITYAVWWIRQAIQECIRRKPESEFIEDVNMSVYTSEEILEDDEDEEAEKDNYKSEDESNVITEEMKNLLSDMLDKLPTRNRVIMEMYFGLNGGEQHTLEEIGEALHISKERVRQIKMTSLKVLRTEIMALDSEEFLSKLYL